MPQCWKSRVTAHLLLIVKMDVIVSKHIVILDVYFVKIFVNGEYYRVLNYVL